MNFSVRQKKLHVGFTGVNFVNPVIALLLEIT